MQWLFAYALAQRFDMDFRCAEWIGEKVFSLPNYGRPDGRPLKRYNELELGAMAQTNASIIKGILEPRDLEFRGYAQTQNCMIYTKRMAQDWLPFQQEVIDRLGGRDGNNANPHPFILAHRRVGDYAGYGYPVVSEESYRHACRNFCFDPGRLMFVTEEKPFEHPWFSDWAPFLPDFFRMVSAPVLLRGNSSYSWLAALLGHGLVLAPVVDGLEGGKEHDCQFVAGNWPRFTSLDFVENLFVAP